MSADSLPLQVAEDPLNPRKPGWRFSPVAAVHPAVNHSPRSSCSLWLRSAHRGQFLTAPYPRRATAQHHNNSHLLAAAVSHPRQHRERSRGSPDRHAATRWPGSPSHTLLNTVPVCSLLAAQMRSPADVMAAKGLASHSTASPSRWQRGAEPPPSGSLR